MYAIDDDGAVFKGLAQGFENAFWEFEKFIEKEYSLMGERNFSRS